MHYFLILVFNVVARIEQFELFTYLQDLFGSLIEYGPNVQLGLIRTELKYMSPELAEQ